MPWSTPTLQQVRGLVRDLIHGQLPGSDATIPNSVLRVMADVQAATCFLTLEYVDWLSLQLLPDTATDEWLDRQGDIWLVNADGTTGRKMASEASGLVSFTGQSGSIIPINSQMVAAGNLYQTTAQITVGSGPTTGTVAAITAGTIGNLDPQTTIAFTQTLLGVDQAATVIEMDGGTNPETDDELRARILQRIQNPAMGGDAADYVTWALQVPGVTRAWSYPNEMGIGTMTVRFLMDDLRADNNGWPEPDDILTVTDHIDKMRPVTVKDCWCLAPIQQWLDITIADLNPNTDECKAEIEVAVQSMLFLRAAPGQTIYEAWISAAIMSAPSVISFDLVAPTTDFVMTAPGYMAVLQDIIYE